MGEIENTDATSSPPEAPKPKTTPQLRDLVEIARTKAAKDEDYARILTAQRQQAEQIQASLEDGEISRGDAIEFYAAINAESASESQIDPLTGVASRPALEAFTEEQVALARRTGRPLSVAYIDIDDFSRVNNDYDHDAGDAALQATGGLLIQKSRRPTDRPGRRGGEEFLWILPDTTEDGAIKIANEFRVELPGIVAGAVTHVGYDFRREVTASIGVATIVVKKEDPRQDKLIGDQLTLLADRRMKLGKTTGKNRVIGSVEQAVLEQAV